MTAGIKRGGACRRFFAFLCGRGDPYLTIALIESFVGADNIRPLLREVDNLPYDVPVESSVGEIRQSSAFAGGRGLPPLRFSFQKFRRKEKYFLILHYFSFGNRL